MAKLASFLRLFLALTHPSQDSKFILLLHILSIDHNNKTSAKNCKCMLGALGVQFLNCSNGSLIFKY